MCRYLVASEPLESRALQRGYSISLVEDGVVFTPDDLALGWVVDVPGKSVAAGSEMMDSLTRPAVPGEPQFEAPDAADRVVQIGVRKWYFAFDENQLATLQTYGGITLLPGDAEVTIKQTQSGGIFKFSE